MAIPKIVQRQLDAAEAQALALTQAPQVRVIDTPSQLDTPPPAPAPIPEPPPTPAPAPAPAENWEHKFRSLLGKVNTEMPELRAREVALTSRVTALTEQVTALTKAPATKPESAAVDPRDAQQFGEDMIEMVQRNARQVYDALKAEFGQMASALEGRVTALEERVVGVTQKTERTLEDSFYSSLAEHVSDWEQVNASQRWLEWLGETDPVYGLPRQTALDSAFERLDAPRVVAIFKKYKDETKAKAVPSLESQLTPASVGGAPQAPSTPAPKQLLSQKFVQNFYTDVAKGRYAQKPQEQERIEAEINLAAQEGRIM